MRKLLVLGVLLMLAGCASRSRDGWNPAVNAAIVGHIGHVNRAGLK